MAQPYNRDKHDIGITRQDGTTVGFMLARDKNGKPVYQLEDDEFITQQQTSTPGYDGLPYEKELRLTQDDWSGGFGQEIYDRNSPNKYLSATGVDARFSHKLLPGGYATTITYPTTGMTTAGHITGTLTNPGFELNNTTSWTDACAGGNTAVSQANTTISGKYNLLMTTGFNNVGAMYQQIAVSAAVAGTVYASAKMYCATANTARIRVTDSGSGSTYSSYHTGVAGTETLTVTHSVTVSATWIRVWFYCDWNGGATSALADDMRIKTYGVGAPYTIAEFNSKIYFAAGAILLSIDSAGTCAFVADFGTAISCLKTFTDSRLYIALGLNDGYWYMGTNEVVIQSTATVSNFQYFERLDAVSPTMYGNDSVSTIRSTINPANSGTAWSTTTSIDSTLWAITCLKSASGKLFIIKGNKPYYLDTSGNVQTLTNMTETIASTTGGIGTTEWQGRLYMPYGVQALLEYDTSDAAFDWKQPSMYGTSLVTQTKTLVGDDQYLYLLTQYGAQASMYWAGCYVTSGSGTQWVWHQLNSSVALGAVYSALVSTAVSSAKYLFVTTSNKAAIYQFNIPMYYGQPESDTSIIFSNGDTFTTSWLHGDFKGDFKAFVSMTLVMKHSYSATQYWTVEYQLVDDSSWTSLGNFTGSATSMTQTKYFSAAAAPKSAMIRFRFTAVNPAQSGSPILSSYSCKCLLYPKRRNIIRCVVRVADGIQDKMKQPCLGKKDLKDTLTEAKDTSQFPFVFYDIDGNTQYCKVLPAQPFYDTVFMEGIKLPEEYCYLNLQIVSFS